MTSVYLLTTDVIKNGSFKDFYDNLSDYRKRKTDRRKLQRDKDLSLVSGLIIDKALGRFGISEKDMIYGESESGKPYFKNRPEIHFNISHSGKAVLCAASEGAVGCDIQIIGETRKRIADKYFSEKEQSYIYGAENDGERNRRFFRLWALKESYLKFTGLGLSDGLSSFEIEPERAELIIDNKKPCYFKEYPLEGYQIAVCGKKNDFADEMEA